VLEVASDDVEKVVLKDEAVADAALVTHCCDAQVLSLGHPVTDYLRNLLEKGPFDEADQKHLVHRDVAVLLIDVFESVLLQVQFHLVDSAVHSVDQTLLPRYENHAVGGRVFEEFVELVLEHVFCRAA